MAKMILPTNFQDDIMNVSMNGKRRYRLINNADGTVSLEDVTTYDQVGSAFGSGQINATNTAVNASADAGKIIDSLDTIKATTQAGYMAGALAVKKLGNDLVANIYVGTDGKLHKVQGGADTVLPFKSFSESSLKVKTIATVNMRENLTYAFQYPDDCDILLSVLIKTSYIPADSCWIRGIGADSLGSINVSDANRTFTFTRQILTEAENLAYFNSVSFKALYVKK